MNSTKRRKLPRAFSTLFFQRSLLYIAILLPAALFFVSMFLPFLFQTVLFQPIVDSTLTALQGYLDQWGRTIKAYDFSLQPQVQDIAQAFFALLEEDPQLSDEQISAFLERRSSLEQGSSSKKIHWSMLTESGIVYRSSSPASLGTDLKKINPAMWFEKLEPLLSGETWLESLSFEVDARFPMIFGYGKLPDGTFFQLGFPMDPVLVEDLWRNLQSFRDSVSFVQSIDAYGSSFLPLANAPALAENDRSQFLEAETRFSSLLVPNGRYRYTVFQNWSLPEEQMRGVFSALRLRLKLDFSKFRSFQTLVVWLVYIFLVGIVFLLLVSEIQSVKRFFRPLSSILNRMKGLAKDPKAFSSQPPVSSSIREWDELSQTFESVGATLSELILQQEITNEILSRNVRKRLETENQLQLLAREDELTGLMNRRFFLETLRQMTSPQNPSPQFFSLAFLDMDNLKGINDSFGHVAGDEILRWVGKVIRHNIRQEDVAARLGGDEFGLLFPGSKPLQAQNVLARILEQLTHKEELFAFLSEEPGSASRFRDLRISFSYGISFFQPGDKTDFQQILHSADSAMYEQKRTKKRLSRNGD
ncbi:MAG TPA: GGDEF domain-containing protein [Thermotogota bacterium]|nr:GGDEF domain-containing protein [Thermotogota bacterium]